MVGECPDIEPSPTGVRRPAVLVNALLSDWLSRTSKTLVDKVGSKRALELVKPYSFHAGMAMILNVKNKTDMGDGYHIPGYSGHFALCCMGMDIRTEIKECGTCSTVTKCNIPHPIPELCVDHFIQMPNGFCNIAAPDCEPILLSSLAKGDEVCRWVIKKKGDPIEKVLNEQAIAEFLPPPLTQDEQRLWEFSYWSEWWMFWLKGLIEYMGAEDAVILIKEAIQGSVHTFLEKVEADRGPIPPGAQGVAMVLNLIDEGMHREGRLEELSHGHIEKIITICPFADAPEAVCQLHEAFNMSICLALDPQIEFAYDRMMTKGDKTCHWTIKKKASVKERSKTEAPSDDPVKILAIRYAMGEITKEELEERMGNLKMLGLVK